MSLAAAVASNALANRLALRFCSAPICRDRQKPLPFRNSAFLGAHGSHGNHVVLLQKGLPRPGLFGWQSRGFASGAEASVRGDAPDQVSLDAFLSIAEVVCVAPSIVFAVGGVIGSLLPGGAPKLFQVNSGNVLFVWQFFLLVGAVVIGGVTRQRQWQRISKYNGATGCDLIQRIEKVEEDLRSSATIVRVLSRQLEKLGIRFRVTRKALKEPIAETATLAQKNSEATRALALQEDILEKELGEIQKVLLAMQEQQQKQLDLILAIAKASRLFEGQRSPSGQDATSLVSEKKKLERTDVQMGKNDKF